ncbi:13433_t:CDS:2 [Gigaspora margarita]|uniref:13433_t:CDS:1 n=1 Tax=Gigaspora margarita TaxID=4874 RepID=A0ABN7VW29_GIGMA|nr:13433_t:CDS:2 [Gigaspora margarita]
MATWINENFELNNAILAVTFLQYPHIADAIAKCIKDVLEHWDLKTKVFSITSDSRANMKLACNKLGVKWVLCSAHILNLIVQKGLLSAKKLITQMNRLITFFTAPKQSERLEIVQVLIQKQQKSNQEKNKESIFLRAQNDVVTRWNSTYNAWVRMLKLKPYIEILASSLTVQSERDAIEDGKRLKSIIITNDEWTTVAGIIKILKPFNDITNYILGSSYLTMSIIYLTISTLHNALLRDYVDEDIDICDTDEIDLDTMDNISLFDLEEVLDDDEQIRSPTATTNLVKRIKNIMSELFARYYQFDDNKILFIAMAIDPRCKNFEYEDAILKCQDYLRLEYNQIRSDEGLGSSSNEPTLDLSGLFISTVFTAVQQNTTYKNEVDQYLMMETIGPLDNPLQ